MSAELVQELFKMTEDSAKCKIKLLNNCVYLCINHECSKCILGNGGFGQVLKGTLLDGRPVAIKRISLRTNGSEELIEANILSQAIHLNILRYIFSFMDSRQL